ncbi:MAG TPA: hypothetical protein VKP30_28405, partial [Polyangiaceae bacterium]|nr:hypothetical protein [Polyangiaceae bacterium]
LAAAFILVSSAKGGVLAQGGPILSHCTQGDDPRLMRDRNGELGTSRADSLFLYNGAANTGMVSSPAVHDEGGAAINRRSVVPDVFPP